MKKIASLIGVGAMVLTLGLGYGFAQQQTTQPSSGGTPSAVQPKPTAPADLEKGKVPATPGVAVKSEKGMPATPSTEKAPVMKETAGKAGDKTVAPQSGVESKSDKSAPAKGMADKAKEKVDEPKPAPKQ